MDESNSTLEVHVASTTQLFPDTSSGEPTTISLSIIDSAVCYFARTAAVWFYDPPSVPELAISESLLQAALSRTLNSYRPWCGRLSYTVPEAKAGHTKRYRRVQVTFDASTDLGVTFITATSPKALSDFIPSPQDRGTTHRAWDGSQLPATGLLPSTRMALSSGNPPPDAPNVLIQITKFACGSTSVGIAIAHGLSDAQGMCTFAKDWASVSRALYASAALPRLSPVFDPQLLDAAAAGNIDAESPDPALVEQARNLPFHRFDWYTEVSSQPWAVHTPTDFDHTLVLSPSDPIPWEDWDPNGPTSHRVLHFTPAEIQHLHTLASLGLKSRISKHDALLAHIWTRINLARKLPPSTTTYIDVTLGLRPRLSLPHNFLGSPIMIAAIPIITPPSSASQYPPLYEIASRIRGYLEVFTTSAIGAFLHDSAFEVSPQRLWQAFLGKKHILQTTWVGAGVYDVNFVGSGSSDKGPKLRFVQPEMGGDGLVLVMEGLGEEKGGHWSQNGADVIIYLAKDVIERMDSDPALWGDGAQ